VIVKFHLVLIPDKLAMLAQKITSHDFFGRIVCHASVGAIVGLSRIVHHFFLKDFSTFRANFSFNRKGLVYE